MSGYHGHKRSSAFECMDSNPEAAPNPCSPVSVNYWQMREREFGQQQVVKIGHSLKVHTVNLSQ